MKGSETRRNLARGCLALLQVIKISQPFAVWFDSERQVFFKRIHETMIKLHNGFILGSAPNLSDRERKAQISGTLGKRW